ncbi:MAG TPA: four helix bundle protein [Mizugakiibacter sp.]
MHYRKTVVWTRAMDVAREIYRIVPLLPREEAYGIRSQITRAAVSVPSNIAEGWTRESWREKLQFLAIAQGSLAELETQLTLCEQIGWFPPEKTSRIRTSVDEVSRMLTALRRRNRKTETSG